MSHRVSSMFRSPGKTDTHLNVIYGEPGFEHKANYIAGKKDVAVLKCANALKLLCRVALVLCVILVFSELMGIPRTIMNWSTDVKRLGFQGKETWWQGSSFDSVRGDVEMNKDSLAEQYLKQQNTSTPPSAPPTVGAPSQSVQSPAAPAQVTGTISNFTPRKETPEEAELKKYRS